LRGKFHPEIPTNSSRTGASNEGGVGKISHFRTLSVNISKSVADTAKINKKSHVSFQLTTRSMTLDDLEMLQGQILSEFRVISRFWDATTAKRMKIGP